MHVISPNLSYLSETNHIQLSLTTMRTRLISLLIPLMFTGLLLSCEGQKSGNSDKGKPAVTVKTQHLSDTSAFTMSNGERCFILADATIDYPVATASGASVDSLQRLFAVLVLESGDSLSLQQAMQQVVTNSMHQYDFMEEPPSAEVADEINDIDEQRVLKYATSTRITPIYNQKGIVTFERVDVVKKNDQVTSVTHRYYSFDSETQTLIDLGQLFRDDAIADVCQLLRQQLLKQNNASGNEQLNDLGYYNVENMTVTRNFYFDENGITWSYLPNELAVEAVGEPKVSISYSDLKPSACDGSIISRF